MSVGRLSPIDTHHHTISDSGWSSVGFLNKSLDRLPSIALPIGWLSAVKRGLLRETTYPRMTGDLCAIARSSRHHAGETRQLPPSCIPRT